MDCPICGHKMGENDAFCSNCGNFSLPLKDNSRPVPTIDLPPGTPADGSTVVSPPPELQDVTSTPSRKVAERLYPPPETSRSPEADFSPPIVADDQGSQEHTPEPHVTESKNESDSTSFDSAQTPGKNEKRLKVLTIVACCLAVLAISVATYITITTSSLRVQLSKAQKESSTAQANAEDLAAQVTDLTESLEAAKDESQSLGTQVTDLQSQINEMETSVNQSQYDKETAERQLEEANTALSTATEENAELQSQLDEAQQNLEVAQSENATLTEENETLSQQVGLYQTEIDFYDSYVVFVMLDSANKYYHRYSCSEFTQRNFLAYSVKLAEANGYSPCPICYGAG